MNNSPINSAENNTEIPITPLSFYIRRAVDSYFAQLNGHSAVNLYDMVLSEVEKPLLEAVMAHCDYTQTKAATALGISRSTLRKKLQKYDLD